MEKWHWSQAPAAGLAARGRSCRAAASRPRRASFAGAGGGARAGVGFTNVVDVDVAQTVEKSVLKIMYRTVSYTHLTLPTKA